MSVTSDKAIVVNPVKRKMIGKYFAIMHLSGWDTEDAKQQAKDRFRVESFNSLSTEQIGILLEELESSFGGGEYF